MKGYTLKEIDTILEDTYVLEHIYQVRSVINEMIDEFPNIHTSTEIRIMSCMINARENRIQSWLHESLN